MKASKWIHIITIRNAIFFHELSYIVTIFIHCFYRFSSVTISEIHCVFPRSFNFVYLPMVCPCTLGAICKQVINFHKEKFLPALKIMWVNIFLSVPLVTVSPTDECYPQHSEFSEFVCQESYFIWQIAKVFLLLPYNEVYLN